VTGTAGNFVPGLNGIAIGGIAGWNFGKIINNSSSSAAITTNTTQDVALGGLAGGNTGHIDHSHASGPITGHSVATPSGFVGVNIGGLVGSLGDVNGGERNNPKFVCHGRSIEHRIR
jgi:hypothetical protein